MTELRAMSLWQYTAVVKGWNDNHKNPDDPEMISSDEEEKALIDFIERPPVWVH